MSRPSRHQAATREASKYVVEDGSPGAESGSTVNVFIDELGTRRGRINNAVAAAMTAERRPIEQVARPRLLPPIRTRGL